jgi:hypothetical protein
VVVGDVKDCLDLALRGCFRMVASIMSDDVDLVRRGFRIMESMVSALDTDSCGMEAWLMDPVRV